MLFWQMQWQTDGYNQGTTSCGSAPGLSLQLILPAWCVPSKVLVGARARRPVTHGLLTGDKCSRAENLPPHSTVNPPLSTLVQQNTGTQLIQRALVPGLTVNLGKLCLCFVSFLSCKMGAMKGGCLRFGDRCEDRMRLGVKTCSIRCGFIMLMSFIIWLSFSRAS